MDLTNFVVERTIIPDIKTRSVNRGAIDIWSFRQRKNLVIFFSHDLSNCVDSQRLFESVADNYMNYIENNAEVLWFSPTVPDKLNDLVENSGIKFPLISDMEKSVAKKFYGDTDYVGAYIVDRFGEISKRYVAKEENELPGQDVLLKYLAYLELRCPECGT